MTVVRRRAKTRTVAPTQPEYDDLDMIEIRVVLMDAGLCLNPAAENGDRDMIPYALADSLRLVPELIEYRSADSGAAWRNAHDGGPPVRFGGKPQLRRGLIEGLLEEEDLEHCEVEYGEPQYFIAANSPASEVLETSVKAGWLPALPGLVLALKACHLLDMDKVRMEAKSGSTPRLRRLLEDAMDSRLELWALLGKQAEEIEREIDALGSRSAPSN